MLGSTQEIVMRKIKESHKPILAAYDKYNGNCAAVGRELDLSRERVRQIVSRYGRNGTGISVTREFENQIVKFTRDNIDTMTCDDVAEHFGISRSMLTRIRKKKGFNRQSRKRSVAARKKWIDIMERLYIPCGGNYSEIARRIGSQGTCVGKAMEAYDLITKYPARGKRFSGRRK